MTGRRSRLAAGGASSPCPDLKNTCCQAPEPWATLALRMNEAETRAEHIDPALKAAGWGVVEGSRVRREYPISPGRIEGHGKRGKALTADYVLEYRNTKLGVLEAKALDEALTEGVAQAKNYADKLALRYT